MTHATGWGCAQVHDLLPELVLEVAEARARAGALEHVATCAACAGHLTTAAAEADRILLAAPAAPPPVELRARVLAGAPGAPARRARPHRGRRVRRPGPSSPHDRRGRVVRVVAAALAAASLFVAAAVLLPWARTPRQPSGAGGHVAARVVALHDGTGRRVGTVVVTAGAGASLLLTFTPSQPAGPYRVRIDDGRTANLDLGEAQEAGGVCAFTRLLPTDPTAVRTVLLTGRDGALAARAELRS